MPAPRIEIELDKLVYNAHKLKALYGSGGIRITAVTKGVCGSPRIATALLNSGIHSLGDSRTANIQKMREAGIDAQFVLIRSPMPSEVERVVEFADVSLNTEISVIRLLSEHAARHGKIHRIILMVELGDLREGILPSNIGAVVNETINLPGVELIGIGTNLACFGGIRPTEANMRTLSTIAGNVQQKYDIRLGIVSGGNSANYQWFVSTPDVGLVNHLRIGEAILLGRDTLTREPIPDLYTDAFTLIAEVIELKTKPSQPYGEIVQDAFGHVPVFEDNGNVRRAILALGRQDTDVSAIRPRMGADVLGASSDHLILDVKDPDLEIGDEVRFDVGYGALLRAMMSPYVEKMYLPQSCLMIRRPPYVDYSLCRTALPSARYVVKQGQRSPSFDVPERVDSILSAISERGLGSVIAPDDAGLEPIRTVHDASMIEYLATAYERQNAEAGVSTPVFPTFFPPPGQRRRPGCFEGQKGFYCTNTGVPIDENTWKAALASAHCAVTGARVLQSGESHVYALCRPPGHHAGPDFFGGYCYLNNAAIAAQMLRENGKRVAILDIDYHHGNGTQAIFYAEPDVWYGSLHIDPGTDYPFFAGYAEEAGRGEGEGTNWNVPLPPGTSQGQYLSALEILLAHLAAFNSQWLIVSAGFDTYIGDPIGTFQLTTAGFNKIGRRIRTLNVPTLVVQEGGYCVPDLGQNVAAFLKGLATLGIP